MRTQPPPPEQYVLRLPKETQKVVKDAIGERSRWVHPGLLLTRYADLPDGANGSTAARWCRKIVDKMGLQRNGDAYRLLDATYQRWRDATRTAERWERHALGRVIVGLGYKGALEIGLTLQHTTGLPYIPGSALKGLCRAYALLTIAVELGVPMLDGETLRTYRQQRPGQPTPLTLLDTLMGLPLSTDRRAAFAGLQDAISVANPLFHSTTPPPAFTLARLDAHPLAAQFSRIFGSQEWGGALIFYDAIIHPDEKGKLLEMDVMTPHYKEYYDKVSQGQPGKPPSDDQNPVPIPFLAVPGGTLFAFAIGSRISDEHSAADRQQTRTWLETALFEMGIGAKTSAGYGHFEAINGENEKR